MVKVLTSYRRRGECYDGVIYLDDSIVWSALNTSFVSIVKALSEVLKTNPDAALIFRRTDREGLNDLPVHTADRDQIRDDPDAYLLATFGHDRSTVVRPQGTPIDTRLRVRSGYDTLADSLGDNIYVRLRDDSMVECPACGRWNARVLEVGEQLHQLQCTCSLVLAFVITAGSWVEIDTMSLILTNFPRYYLPRAWNRSGSWITREELMQQYDRYLKETQDVR